MIFSILSSRSLIHSFASVILLLILDFLIAQLVKTCLQCRRPWVDSWVRKIPWKRDRLPTPIFLGCPGGLDSKQSVCNAGDPSSFPGSGRSPGKGINYPLQYSWTSLVAQMVKNLPAMWETWVQLLGWEDPLENVGEVGMASYSSILLLCPHGQRSLAGYSLWGRNESDTTEQLSTAPLHQNHIYTDRFLDSLEQSLRAI